MVAQLCSRILFLFSHSFFYLNLLNITSTALRRCTKSLHHCCNSSSVLIIWQVFAGGKFNQKSVEQKKGKFMLWTLTLYQAITKNNATLFCFWRERSSVSRALVFGWVYFVYFFLWEWYCRTLSSVTLQLTPKLTYDLLVVLTKEWKERQCKKEWWCRRPRCHIFTKG